MAAGRKKGPSSRFGDHLSNPESYLSLISRENVCARFDPSGAREGVGEGNRTKYGSV